eukprot:8872650-Pyramimonas_sp.AAC.1
MDVLAAVHDQVAHELRALVGQPPPATGDVFWSAPAPVFALEVLQTFLKASGETWMSGRSE